jgi:hypothetical protein
MTEQNPFREVYALIWRANEPDDMFDSGEI